jgi:uncharacterized protein (DUF2384 family)
MATFEDQHTQSNVAGTSVEQMVLWLQSTIGRKLTAFAADLDSPADLARYAEGDQPDRDTERRLRNLYAVAWMLAVDDGPGTAHEWLIEPNPELDDRAPVELLHEGKAPEAVWFAAAPVF